MKQLIFSTWLDENIELFR